MQEKRQTSYKDLVFCGRSNVGKSSLINAITGQDVAITSKRPGKTRDLTYYSLEKEGARLVDCPGYGYARASQVEKEQWNKLMQVYLGEA